MRRTVLRPLGMEDSTFVVDPAETARLAGHFNTQGRRVHYRRFTAQAAASLHTTVEDLARFFAAHLRHEESGPPGRGVVSPELLDTMLTPRTSEVMLGAWGLGRILYELIDPPKRGIFGHDGRNRPGIGTTARLDRETGEGIILLSSGQPMLAPAVGDEWSSWQARARRQYGRRSCRGHRCRLCPRCDGRRYPTSKSVSRTRRGVLSRLSERSILRKLLQRNHDLYRGEPIEIAITGVDRLDPAFPEYPAGAYFSLLECL